MDYSLPGSSIHGISQARILEWATMPFSRDLPDPGMEPGPPASGAWGPSHWTTREVPIIFLLEILFVPFSRLAQLVKNPPAVRETWVRSLGWEDLLENGKATHSSIMAWRIPRTV